MAVINNKNKNTLNVWSVIAILGAGFAISSHAADGEDSAISATGSDGVTIHGTTYFGELDADAPLVLLFHQGGSNGRGEYSDIAPWLNDHGFRAIAWDLRAGGELYGSSNRTKLGLNPGTPADYCDAYSDLQAALTYTVDHELAEKVIVWGSSYSGALIFRLAADHPNAIAGVVAFSPASGGPMVGCRARRWAAESRMPKIAFKPTSEMTRESSIEQKEILENAGADFVIVENGVHGSSMLVDERTEHDMAATRAQVIAWLNDLYVWRDVPR